MKALIADDDRVRVHREIHRQEGYKGESASSG
jgi:hypothetical protein